MSDLTKIEKLKLEKLLGMRSGYVLDFSDRTFFEFILESTCIDMNEEKYKFASCSKANKLRKFWDVENNYTVGKLTVAFLEYWEAKKNTLEFSPEEEKSYNECLQISKRLMQNGDPNEDIAIDTHFEKIQSNIIEQIKLARFTIWVAVAWFTDGKIFQHLVTKKNEGINIQLVIVDDDINRKSGLDYDREFETYRIQKFGIYEDNMMHNKFCVIDLKTVIHGSYNWTKKAKFNQENITVINGREVAEQFAERFIKLKNAQRKT